MDYDCNIRSEKSWWDWLEKEPGLCGTIWFLGTVLIVSVVLYLSIFGGGG